MRMLTDAARALGVAQDDTCVSVSAFVTEQENGALKEQLREMMEKCASLEGQVTKLTSRVQETEQERVSRASM
jgi:hypothetical protein